MQVKILGFFLLLISVLGGLNLIFVDQQSSNKSPQKLNIKSDKNANNKKLIINKVWRTDFQRLLKSGEIPVAWGKINQVLFIPTDPLTVELAQYLQAPVKINKDGEYRLEVSIMSHQSESDKTQVLLQHNIIDTQNENTIWELNKTYNLYSN